MSQWIERIRAHPVWDLLASVGLSISTAVDREENSPEATDSLERLRTVCDFCGRRIATCDPAIVMPAVLDSMIGPLTQLKVSIEAYSNSGEIAHLHAASAQADATLNVMPGILGTLIPDELTTIGAAASSYRATLERHLATALAVQKEIKEKNAANEEKIAALQDTLNVEYGRATSLYTDQQSQFSAAQDKRATDFAASQAEFLAKYTTAATDQQTQFSSDQDARKTSFSEFQREGQQKVADLLVDYDQKLKDHNTDFSQKEKDASIAHQESLKILHIDYKNNADAILGEMQQHKTAIESLVGVIGNLGVTSGYKKIADRARHMLLVWQLLTVLALGGLIFIAYLIAFPNGKASASSGVTATQLSQDIPNSPVQNESKITANKIPEASKLTSQSNSALAVGSGEDKEFYHGLITRIFLSVACGIFAAYAARQASNFLTIEQKNRKMALELEALGPFIEPLNKEERDKFRILIGDRSFGVPDYDALKPKDDDPVNLLALLKSKDFKELLMTVVKDSKKD